MKRLLIYIIEILICFLIQSSMFHYIALANVMPNLLLILIVSTAYMRGRTSGLLLGFFCGLLVDISFGNVIGLYAIFYMVIGYLNGYTNKFYSSDDYTLPIILVAISNFMYGFFYYVIEFLLRNRLNFLYYLRRIILTEMIYTVAVSIVLYKLLHIINKRLDRDINEEA